MARLAGIRERAYVSATPGARNEYSRGTEGSQEGFSADRGPVWRDARRRSPPLAPGIRGLIFLGAILAAGLLVVAEFATLYQVHLATRVTPIQTVTAGSHNSYAMIPIAAVALVLGIAVWRTGSRPVLLALGVLGLVALLIALLHDLPDAHASGLAEHNTISATTTPGAGLYLETLGAIVLIAVSGLGFLMGGGSRQGGGGPADRPGEGGAGPADRSRQGGAGPADRPRQGGAGPPEGRRPPRQPG